MIGMEPESETPMLRRLVIQNYRSCFKTTLDLDTNLSVLIGANGSGKTNILQAIMLLNKMARREAYQTRADSIMLTPHLAGTFEFKTFEARMRAAIDAYTDESNNDVILGTKERWNIKESADKSSSHHLPLSMFGPGRHSRAYTVHYAPQQLMMFKDASARRFRSMPPLDMPPYAIEGLMRVARFCANISYYGASQFTNPGSCPVSFEIEQEGDRSRLFQLRSHRKILYDMYLSKEAKEGEPFRQFMEIVGSRGLKLIDDLKFRKVETSSIDYSVRVGGKLESRRKHKLLIIPQFRIGKQRLSPNQLSEGTFKTLALVFHMITADSTAMLIEEPEVCVHHGLLSSILELAKSYSRNKMIILSTHSDYVLDHVAPENVHRVIFSKDEGTVVKNIRKTMTVKEFAALRAYLRDEGNLGEYWREGGLGDLQ